MKITIKEDGNQNLNIAPAYSSTRIYIPSNALSSLSQATVSVFSTVVDSTELLSSGSILVDHGRGSIVYVNFSGVLGNFDLEILND